MNKSIRLLVEGFFDDELFNVNDDINQDIADIGDQYYDYIVGDIYYKDKKPYAVCCGEPKYFNDNKPRFCLLKDSKRYFRLRTKDLIVKKLKCFEFDSFTDSFTLKSFNDFLHIDENGYLNTLIIKNNYNIFDFPAFKYCIELGDNIYLPAIDELLMIILNKDKLSKYSLRNDYYYWSSTLYSVNNACVIIFTILGIVGNLNTCSYSRVRPFFHLD